MWKFIKRQAKTKTGKLAMAIIAGTAASYMPGVDQYAGAIQEAILNPQTAAISLLGMFLRDGPAKKGE